MCFLKEFYETTSSHSPGPVPTGERNKRKTKVATYVNFIHQKDSFIAMKVVDKLTNETKRRAPVYTVHENLITTSIFADRISKEVFMEMGHPLVILNEFMKKRTY